MTEWAQLAKWAIAWGPGILILAGLYLLVRRPPAFVGAFIDAQQSQAVAMTKMADAVERVTARDNDRLDEILINNQVIIRRLEELAHEFVTLRP